jgi:hypothetical protein
LGLFRFTAYSYGKFNIHSFAGLSEIGMEMEVSRNVEKEIASVFGFWIGANPSDAGMQPASADAIR